MIQALWIVLMVGPSGEVERVSPRALSWAHAVALEGDLRMHGVAAIAARLLFTRAP
jgi:hypothetical protein